MQLRSLTCDHHDLGKDGLAGRFRLWTTERRETLETSACYHSCLPLHVSVGYLGFFNQLQQVFDMLSQQILALPHLIQSSERIQKKEFSPESHGPTNVSKFVYKTWKTYLTAFVSRVAYR